MSNPYTPGEPVDDPELFCGRRDILVAIRGYLLRGRNVFLVAGARRMGKTSLLYQLERTLADTAIPVRVELEDDTTQRLDWLLWRIADTIAHAAGTQMSIDLPRPAWDDYEGHPERFLDQLAPMIRTTLGDRNLLLMLDDVDSLARSGERLLEGLFETLAEWKSRDEYLALVLTTSVARQEELVRSHPALLGGVLTYVLGPLSGEEAIRLVTWPVEGALTYDYGVPRRLAEIASGHPYFLQLLCYEVFERCATAGWVNQRDLDAVADDLLGRELSGFRLVWDESSPQEQAALAALVSLRGARGMATALEVHTVLSKAGAKARRHQVESVLEQLVARGVLERLGALSYRFRVGLMREWLEKRLELEDVVRKTRWSEPGRRQTSSGRTVRRLSVRRERASRTPKTQTEEPETQGKPGETGSGSRMSWRLWGGVASTFAIAVVLVLALWVLPSQPEAIPTATPSSLPTQVAVAPSSTATPGLTSSPVTVPTTAPSPTKLPTSTPQPTPTPPVVLSRPVPAIAFYSKRSQDRLWSVYVMDSDGGNRAPVIEAQAAFLSAPSWSPDGKRIAFVSDGDSSADIWVVDSDGSAAVNLTQDEASDSSPAWSPDGEWLAFASVRDSVYWELYTMRPDGSEVQRLTWWEDASDLWPTWSPDGERLAFSSRRDGNFEVYAMDRDGGNLLRLTSDAADDTNPAWSPDGSRIAFESIRGDDAYTDIYVMPAIGGEAKNLTALPWATDRGPTWSPDGGRIAFYSDREGGWDIFVMASDGSNVTKVSGAGSSDQLPSWRP